MFAFISHWEIIAIVIVLLLLFGGKKIPELAKGLGTGIREFQKGMRSDGGKEIDESEKRKDEGDQSGA